MQVPNGCSVSAFRFGCVAPEYEAKGGEAHVTTGPWKSLEALCAACAFQEALGTDLEVSKIKMAPTFQRLYNICIFKESDVLFNTASRRNG